MIICKQKTLKEELGTRLFLGKNGSKIGGLFIETGKLLKQQLLS